MLSFAVVPFYQVIPAVLLIACLTSFGWGVRTFFVLPSGHTTGMRVVTAAGVLFAVLHLAAVLPARGASFERSCAGALIYAVSLALFWWAIWTNRRRPLSAVYSWDTPVHLVQEGPYRYIRHPFYCSYLLAWCAGCVAASQWWLTGTVAVALVIYRRAAHMEERKFSCSPLAGAYIEYQNRTGLFVPNPWKLVTARRCP